MDASAGSHSWKNNEDQDVQSTSKGSVLVKEISIKGKDIS